MNVAIPSNRVSHSGKVIKIDTTTIELSQSPQIGSVIPAQTSKNLNWSHYLVAIPSNRVSHSGVCLMRVNILMNGKVAIPSNRVSHSGAR